MSNRAAETRCTQKVHRSRVLAQVQIWGIFARSTDGRHAPVQSGVQRAHFYRVAPSMASRGKAVPTSLSRRLAWDVCKMLQRETAETVVGVAWNAPGQTTPAIVYACSMYCTRGRATLARIHRKLDKDGTVTEIATYFYLSFFLAKECPVHPQVQHFVTRSLPSKPRASILRAPPRVEKRPRVYGRLLPPLYRTEKRRKRGVAALPS